MKYEASNIIPSRTKVKKSSHRSTGTLMAIFSKNKIMMNGKIIEEKQIHPTIKKIK
jgi:hypothetical protein